MKTNDVAKIKSEIKTALQEWVELKIGELFPSKPQTKVILKRGINNWMNRADGKLNSTIDTAMLFVADESGNIDTGEMFDMALDMFREMEVHKYQIGMIPVSVGNGKIVAEIPHHPILDMVVGNLGKVTITADDFLELKEIINI